MKIFRQLRWQLTLSYTIVTVSAFLVILLIMGGLVLAQIFIPENYLGPQRLVEIISEESTPIFSYILSQSPVDTNLINQLLKNPGGTISSVELFGIGALKFSATTNATMRVAVIGADGTILGTYHGGSLETKIGQPIDAGPIPGLAAPLKAALAGESDSKRLYSVIEPNQRYVLAVPVFNRDGGDESQVLGVLVIFFDSFPTRADVPAHILQIAARSLLIFLLGIGGLGAVFGAFFAHRLAVRFKQMSATTDLWSEGDFSRYIDDTTGDEISQFAGRLNNMAQQLQSLLHRRQEMAVSEERNRLARDLHDSAKQQALAASLELGAALTLYDRDPGRAKKHLVEADALVDAVRKELTSLVDELRPLSLEEQDFVEILKEHAIEWSNRSGIELDVDIQGDSELSLETRETLFRIAQEALANIARHSAASHADVSLEYGMDSVTLTIKDNGRGFEPYGQHAGLGLSSMRERAEVLGGSFKVESAPGQGTQIVVILPQGS